jgi:hypothetical protein
LESKKTFIKSDHRIAVCGKYFGKDSVHVGLYWNFQNTKSVFHFLNGEKIPIQNADSNYFDDYLFNPIINFPEFLLPTLIAISELISENKLNGFVFNREGFIYDGGKFDFNSGNYVVKPVEKIMNCGVFIVALLNTFDFKLINWNSWPNQEQTDYLNHWLFYK